MPRTIAPLNGSITVPTTRPVESRTSARLGHVEGLRGLSIALVVIFHVFIGRVSSGVDVFLFLGGVFLLSSQMSSAAQHRSGMIQSLIRIMRRLLPVLVVVVTSTIVAFLFTRPPALWEKMLTDAAAAVGYWENWNLALSGFSYSAAGQEVSVFQHLWSMSAQLQIYVVVIVVVYLVTAIGQFCNVSTDTIRRILIIMVSITGACSFGYATYMTSHDQSVNYYSSLSRFWEIAAGCLFGLVMNSVVLGAGLRWIAGIVGLSMIIPVGLLIDGVHQFPGPWTLVPLTGAALVVISGVLDTGEYSSTLSRGPAALLDSVPMRWVGGISYSLYLIHWPILILTLALSPVGTSRIVVGVPVIVVSVLIAWGLKVCVEDTLRQHQRPAYASVWTMLSRGYRLRARRLSPSIWYPISACVTVITAVAVLCGPMMFTYGERLHDNRAAQTVAAAGGRDIAYPGSGALLNKAYVPAGMPLMPDLTDLDSMLPQADRDRCASDFGNSDLVLTKSDGSPCSYGDTSSARTLYIVGGSHAEQYLTALDVIGKRRGIKIMVIVKLGCPLNSQEARWDGADFTECRVWSAQNAVPWILANPPTEGVFTTVTRPTTISGAGPEVVPPAYVEVQHQLADAGISVYGMRDNPWMLEGSSRDVQKNVRICLSDGRSSTDCGAPLKSSLLPVNPAIDAYRDIPSMHLLDMTPAICTHDPYDIAFCPGVVGNIVAYRDSHHLTAQLISTMTDFLESQMFPAPAPAPISSTSPPPVSVPTAGNAALTTLLTPVVTSSTVNATPTMNAG